MRTVGIRLVALLLLLPGTASAHDHVGSVSADGSFMAGSFLAGAALVGEWVLPPYRHVSFIAEVSSHFGEQNESSLPLSGLRFAFGNKPATFEFWGQAMIGHQVTAEKGGAFAWAVGVGTDQFFAKSGVGLRIQVDYMQRPNLDEPERKKDFFRLLVGPVFRFGQH